MPRAPEATATEPRHRGRSRAKWRLAIVLLALAGLVMAAPTIALNTPIKDALLAKAIPAEAGSVTVAGGSLSWTGPTTLTGLKVLDPEGVVIATAEAVRIDRSLLQLVTGEEIGVVRVDRPTALLEYEPGGSSRIERLLTRLDEIETERELRRIEQGLPPSADRPVAVDVQGGMLRINDLTTDEIWLADGLNATFTQQAKRLDAIGLKAEGRLGVVTAVGAPMQQTGDFALELLPGTDGVQRARFTAASLPLSAVAPLVRRIDPECRLIGVVDGQGEATWGVPSAAPAAPPAPVNPLATLAKMVRHGLDAAGQLRVTTIEAAGAPTGGVPLRMNAVEIPWRLTAQGGRLLIKQLEAATDIGRARVTGSVSDQELEAWGAGSREPPADLKFNTELNLARFGAVAPGVLRLREDVRIESGQVALEVISTQGPAGPRLTGTLRTEDLAGVAAGQPLRWDAPLKADFVATSVAGRTVIESLECESGFLSASLSGDALQGQGKLAFDLNQLATQLGQFVDLTEWRCAGRGDAEFRYEHAAPGGPLRLQARGEAASVLVAYRDTTIADESSLRFDAEASGAGLSLASGLGGVDSGALTLTSGVDRLQAAISGQEATPGAPTPFQLTVEGQLDSWLRRLRLVSPSLPSAADLQLAGALKATATGVVGPQGGELRDARVSCTNLDLRSGPLWIREPQVEATGSLAWDNASGLVRSNAAQLVSSSAAIRARNLQLPLSDASAAPPAAEFAIRTNLQQLAGWFTGAAPAAPGAASYQMAGEIEGTVLLAAQPQADGSAPLAAQANFKGTGLELRETRPGAAQRVVWSEPTADLACEAVYFVPLDRVELRTMQLNARSLSATASGQIDRPAQLSAVRLAGAIDYDLERLSALLLPQLGGAVRLIGRDQARFEIANAAAGSQPTPPPGADATHWSRRLVGRVEAPWQSGDLFGLALGPGRVAAVLGEGAVRFEPLDFTVGQGRFTTQPSMRLDPEPALVSVAPGPVVANVAISPQVAEKVLKFIAPVLADATRVDGQFSMALTEFTAPAADVAAGRATGQLRVHSARVAPGPSVAQWVALAEQVQSLVRGENLGALIGGQAAPTASGTSAALLINDRAIDFQLANRRVYHSGLEFALGDVIIQSQGSVGADETLDLLLSVPVLDEWVAQRPVILAGLKGKAIQIPIAGTFDRPQVNSDAVKQLSRDLLQSAAAGAIDQGLGRLLDRLRSN
ncbi:hypothetical protein [Pseudobythopirellula maris]|uniref:hypothetical protein n=1 Tax=Pseudobythopirellula maris TaxID=2527991 RepID=UPI0011B47433|nr:hypothetical protein [Pseudobythopirellula maris]